MSERDCGYFIQEEIEKLCIKNSFTFLKDASISRKQKCRYPSTSDLESEEFIFPDGQKLEDLPKPPNGHNYWENLRRKVKYYDFEKADIEVLLDERIEFLLDYSQRFLRNKLTEKETNKPIPENYKGPYLPTAQDIEVIENIDLVIKDWTPSQANYRTDSEPYMSFFSKRHDDILFSTWEEFQKKHKVNDIRPLIGERCVLVWRNENGEIKYSFYRLLSYKRLKLFYLHMLKNLPTITSRQISRNLSKIADFYERRKEIIILSRRDVDGLEMHMMELTRKKLPADVGHFRFMSTFIGKRSGRRYSRVYQHIYRFHCFPFRDDPLSAEEELLVLNNVAKSHHNKDLKSVVESARRINWTDLFLNIKVRQTHTLQTKWSSMKKSLCTALHDTSGQAAAREYRYVRKLSHEQTIKLIDTIYHSEKQSMREIDWGKLAVEFPGFCDLGLSQWFWYIYRYRVPKQKQKYFDDALEYLYHQVKPLYKLKDIRSNKMKGSVDGLVKNYNLQTSKGEKVALSNFFSRAEERDNDEEYRLMVGEEEVSLEAGAPIDEERRELSEEERRRRLIPFCEDETCKIWKGLMLRSGFKSTFHESLFESEELRDDKEERGGATLPLREEEVYSKEEIDDIWIGGTEEEVELVVIEESDDGELEEKRKKEGEEIEATWMGGTEEMEEEVEVIVIEESDDGELDERNGEGEARCRDKKKDEEARVEIGTEQEELQYVKKKKKKRKQMEEKVEDANDIPYLKKKKKEKRRQIEEECNEMPYLEKSKQIEGNVDGDEVQCLKKKKMRNEIEEGNEIQNLKKPKQIEKEANDNEIQYLKTKKKKHRPIVEGNEMHNLKKSKEIEKETNVKEILYVETKKKKRRQIEEGNEIQNLKNLKQIEKEANDSEIQYVKTKKKKHIN